MSELSSPRAAKRPRLLLAPASPPRRLCAIYLRDLTGFLPREKFDEARLVSAYYNSVSTSRIPPPRREMQTLQIEVTVREGYSFAVQGSLSNRSIRISETTE